MQQILCQVGQFTEICEMIKPGYIRKEYMDEAVP